MNISAQGKMAMTLLGTLKACPGTALEGTEPQLWTRGGVTEAGYGCTGLKATIGAHKQPVEQLNTATSSLFFVFPFLFLPYF